MDTCSLCSEDVAAKGLCATHYQRFRRTGSTFARPEKRELKPALVRLGKDQLKALKQRAIVTGLDVSELVRRAVDRLVAFEHPDGIVPDQGLAAAPEFVRTKGDRSHLVYAMVDPRDGLPRYVGQSLADQQGPKPAPTSVNHRLRLWLNELRSKHQGPRSVVLERVMGDANERHEAWVRAGFAVGWPLLQPAPAQPMWNFRQDRGRGERR